jgi:undecaprenyl-diphosphatase
MIDTLKQWDTYLFLYLNGFHNSIWDSIMFWASEKITWIPVYMFFIFLIIRNYKREAWLIIPVALIMILFSDQLSLLVKNLTCRPRPCHVAGLENVIHLVQNKCGGEFGFVSSHAANHFGMALFFGNLFRSKFRFINLVLIFWAGFISYSRIYLGAHYPGDVIFGGFLGVLLGISFYQLLLQLNLKIFKK